MAHTGGLLGRINIHTTSVTYAVDNAMGSTSILMIKDGKIDGTYTYSAYGQATHEQNTPSTVITFDGGWNTSNNGTYYFVHRYYTPETGSFLSVDPLVDTTGQPYAHAADDPVNGSDPSGTTGTEARAGIAIEADEAGLTAIYVLVHADGDAHFVGRTIRAPKIRLAEHSRGTNPRFNEDEGDEMIDLVEVPNETSPIVEQFIQQELDTKKGFPGNRINAVSPTRIPRDVIDQQAPEIIARAPDGDQAFEILQKLRWRQQFLAENDTEEAKGQFEEEIELNGGFTSNTVEYWEAAADTDEGIKPALDPAGADEFQIPGTEITGVGGFESIYFRGNCHAMDGLV
jgi:RHS repeat-associated protein